MSLSKQNLREIHWTEPGINRIQKTSVCDRYSDQNLTTKIYKKAADLLLLHYQKHDFSVVFGLLKICTSQKQFVAKSHAFLGRSFHVDNADSKTEPNHSYFNDKKKIQHFNTESTVWLHNMQLYKSNDLKSFYLVSPRKACGPVPLIILASSQTSHGCLWLVHYGSEWKWVWVAVAWWECILWKGFYMMLNWIKEIWRSKEETSPRFLLWRELRDGYNIGHLHVRSYV